MITIETVEQRKKDLLAQMEQRKNDYSRLQNELNQTQALINAIEGALLDCDYWLGLLADSHNNEKVNDND